MKKNILFMPSWYPTKENPLSGSFFKEQAKVLTANFNFVVLHIQTVHLGFRSSIKKIFTKKLKAITYDKADGLLQEVTLTVEEFFPRMFFRKALHKIPLHSKKILAKELQKDFGFAPDLLYAVTAQVNAAEAAELASFFDIPYIVAEHCPFPLPGTAISTETKNAIQNADCILSISRDKTRQMLIQGLTIYPELVGNMVDEDTFVLPAHKKDEGIFTILIVAANNFYKDYPTFFKTMCVLKNNCRTPFKVLIVGYNPVVGKSIWNEGEKEFEQMVENYGISQLCELIPRVSREEMPNYYHKADVFVMTSIQEGFPVSSLEATSCGLPVYATRCGGVEDFIDDDNGRIVNIQDYDALAYELKKLIDEEVTYDSKLIRKKTVERYGKEAFKKRLTDIFNRTIKEYKQKSEI